MDSLQAQVNNKWQIESNLTEIETQLREVADSYKGIIVTEDTIKDSKKDLADLRKIRTSIEDARKEVKKQWEVPYKEFESKCKNLLAICDEPIEEINKQLTDFELQRVLEKHDHLVALYNENIGEYAEYLPFDNVYKKQWDNATYKDKDIIYDISEAVTKVRGELAIIKGLHSDIETELLEIYKANGNNLALAIQRNSNFISDMQTVKDKIRDEQEQTKPKAEAMGELNNIVNAFRTVSFIVSKDDAESVEGMLSLAGISYRKVDG